MFASSSFGEEDDDDGESDDSSASGVDDSSESDDSDRMYETIYHIYLLILLCRIWYNYRINNGGLKTLRWICCGSILFLVQILLSFVFGYCNVW